MEPLNASNLSKKFGKNYAVKNASFSISEGEIVGFIGENGAGKSTTINQILGFLSPTSGIISIYGEGISPEKAAKSHRNLGFATGDMTLFNEMTGEKYLEFLAASFRKKIVPARKEELSEVFLPQLSKKIGTMSRGNRQKIALMSAFLLSPKLVILDEPSNGLDPIIQENFLDFIKKEKANGTTIFMSSHYLTEVAEVCDRIIMIKNGKIIRDQPIKDILNMRGKKITLETKSEITLPNNSRDLQKFGEKSTFTFEGKTEDLLNWLSSIKNLTDFSVQNMDLESIFMELYKESENEK